MAIGPTVTAVVTAKDEASETLKRIAALCKDLSKSLKQSGGGLTEHLDKANAAAAQHVRAIGAMERAYRGAFAAAKQFASNVTALAAPGVLHASEGAMQAGAKRQAELQKLALSGMTPDQAKEATQLSITESARNPTLGQDRILENIRLLRAASNPEEATKLLPAFNDYFAGMNQLGLKTENIEQIVKAAESLNVATDPAKFRAFIDSQLRFAQVAGSTIHSEDYLNFARRSSTAGLALDEHFRNKTMPTLMQEMGGDQLGTSLRAFAKTNQGAHTPHGTLKEFIDLGLAKDEDFNKLKNGQLSGFKFGKHIEGYDLSRSDPASWIQKYFIPALEKRGITSQKDQLDEVAKIYQGTGSKIVELLITQQQLLRRREEQTDAAAGIDGSLKIQGDSAIQQWHAVQEAFESFAGTLTSPIMADAAHALGAISHSVAEWSAALAKFQGEHPILGKAAAAIPVGIGAAAVARLYSLFSGMMGAFTGGATGGIALQGSAAALTAAAGALEAAAAAQGAGGAVGAAGALSGVASAAVKAEASMLELSVGGARLMAGLSAIGGVIGALAVAAGYIDTTNQKPDANGKMKVGAGIETWFADFRQRTSDWWHGLSEPEKKRFERRDVEGPLQPGHHRPQMTFDTAIEDEALRQAEERNRQRIAKIETEIFAPNNKYSIPGSAIAGQPQKPVDVNVHGDVRGNVEIMNKVVVEPSPLLQSIVREAQKATAQVSGALDKLGHTMPPDSGVMPSPAFTHAPFYAH